MIYLLDANVWIGLLRGTSAVLFARFRAAAPWVDLRIGSAIVGELWYGCARCASPDANRTAVDALIAPYPSMPYDDRAADLAVRTDNPGLVS